MHGVQLDLVGAGATDDRVDVDDRNSGLLGKLGKTKIEAPAARRVDLTQSLQTMNGFARHDRRDIVNEDRDLGPRPDPVDDFV